MLEEARSKGPMRDAPMEFLVAMMNSLAEATMDFTINDPGNADVHRRVGFDALWRIVSG